LSEIYVTVRAGLRTARTICLSAGIRARGFSIRVLVEGGRPHLAFEATSDARADRP